MTIEPSPSLAVEGASVGAARIGLTGLQGRVFALCALVAFLDGFDTQSIGPAAPAIVAALGIKLSAFGSVFSVSQVGFLCGSLIFSAAGDRFGRKKILALSTVLFALASLGTALSGTLPALLAARFVAGLGLGGATPNFVGLVSEFSLPELRARRVTILWAAVPFGGMAGAFASSAALPTLGWQAMFYLGCAAPLLLVPLLLKMLPESAEAAHKEDGVSVGRLFAQGRALATVWLWLASFMTWTLLISVAFWTPALLKQAGFTPSAAASVLAFSNAGGVIGTLIIGAAIGRYRLYTALLTIFPAAAVLVAVIGLLAGGGAFVPVAATAAAAGFFSSAAGGGILAVSASIYPGTMRATAVGWALGFGRIGSIVGPMAVGALVAQAWPVSSIYFALALPAVAATVFVALLARH
ncbi:MAG TPA: MFS transporter [Magnetospirillaceae bacterium]|nr:MFS transporter [Magnetospirillaceae bacterium]